MLLVLLLAVVTGTAHAQVEKYRVIRLITRDDLGLSAAYYPVDVQGAPAVLLLHSRGKDRDEWADIAPIFRRNGIAALALDLRGHGESVRRLTADGPQRVDYQKFRPRDYQDMMMDLNMAFDWLADQPGIDKHRIGIIGADLGANLALRYAAFNDQIAALLLLSPSLDIQGIRTEDIITKIGKRPLRIAAAREDLPAFRSAKRLLDLRKEAGQTFEDGELVVSTGDLHGEKLLTGVQDLPAILFGWLQRKLQENPAAP